MAQKSGDQFSRNSPSLSRALLPPLLAQPLGSYSVAEPSTARVSPLGKSHGVGSPTANLAWFHLGVTLRGRCVRWDEEHCSPSERAGRGASFLCLLHQGAGKSPAPFLLQTPAHLPSTQAQMTGPPAQGWALSSACVEGGAGVRWS